MEYPKALYLAGQQILVDNEEQEATARVGGYDDWCVDAARGEATEVPEASEQSRQIDVDVLRETEARLFDLTNELREREERLTARENELAAREEAVVAAEAVLLERQAAADGGAAGAGDEQQLDREALKARAAELNIDFPRNISTENLAALVAKAKV